MSNIWISQQMQTHCLETRQRIRKKYIPYQSHHGKQLNWQIHCWTAGEESLKSLIYLHTIRHVQTKVGARPTADLPPLLENTSIILVVYDSFNCQRICLYIGELGGRALDGLINLFPFVQTTCLWTSTNPSRTRWWRGHGESRRLNWFLRFQIWPLVILTRRLVLRRSMIATF